MQTRFIDGITVRPLRNGDTATVTALLARVGGSQLASEIELTALARVDGAHHALVAYLGADPEPAGIAQLVRDGSAAEVFYAVADGYQGDGIGGVLHRQLAADARAAGITELRTTELSPSPRASHVAGEEPRALGFLSRLRQRVDPISRGSARVSALGLSSPRAGRDVRAVPLILQQRVLPPQRGSSWRDRRRPAREGRR